MWNLLLSGAFFTAGSAGRPEEKRVASGLMTVLSPEEMFTKNYRGDNNGEPPPGGGLMKRLLCWGILLLIVFLAGRAFLFAQNNWLVVTRQTITVPSLPESREGFTIVHLSDLHGQMFGSEQSYLLRLIKQEQPDIVVCTGDMVDSNTYNPEPLFALLDGLAGLPVYYVPGNHEIAAGSWDDLAAALRRKGVVVLDDDSRMLEAGAGLRLAGITDPGVRGRDEDGVVERLSAALAERKEGEFTVLLAHRPEHFALYAAAGADLTLSGHAHGGQVILPGIGGLVAPGQGFFPEYYAGMYSRGAAALIVSRGLGNSVVKQRLFNRPEIVVITMRP
jgi:predicted MPP superfamily phosphohydrolase